MPYICLNCIEDKQLREIITDDATPILCGYCKKRASGVELRQLAKIIDKYLRDYCCQGEDVPRFHGDSDKPDYEQEGDPLVWLLQEELGIDIEPAEELAKILEENDPIAPEQARRFFRRKRHIQSKRCLSQGPC